MAGKIVNKAELAGILDKAQSSITRWQAQGMPYLKGEGQGMENQYDTAAVVDWIVRKETKGGLDKETEQARLLQEQTEIARRRNLKEAGDLIELSQATLVVQRIAFAIRQKVVTSALPLQTRQGILADLQSLRNVDFRSVKGSDDATTDEAETS